jgi:hypothetical protein
MNDFDTLFHEAVSDVEPTDRLTQIRAVVRRQRTRRLWLVSGGSAVIAAAATVAAVALVSTPKTSAGPEPGPATNPPSSDPTIVNTAPPSAEAPVGTVLMSYFLGGTADQPKLYRAFPRVQREATPAAALFALESTPLDPDYRTLWPQGAFAWAKVDSDLITVELADGSLHDRPSSMSPAEAEASIQQVVYTMQALAQKRLPVQFTLNGNPIDQVLGVPTSEPLANAPILQTLSRVNLTLPAEGQKVTRTIDVDGVANSFEANVTWSLENVAQLPIASGSFTATGYMAEKLFPFRGVVDVSSLDPGTYTFIVRTDDPSGAGKVDEDSRTVIIR